MKLPTKRQGQAAFSRGQDDAIAGVGRDSGPWDPFAPDIAERCLSAAYQRGYGYGLQVAIQDEYGNAPTA